MWKWPVCILAMAVVLQFIGCSGISVSTDYHTTKDFSTLKTFAWMEAPSSKQGQGYDASALTDSRIKEASAKTDLLVVYHVGTQKQLEIDDYGYGGWYGGGGVDAYTYEEGTLIVDLVDAATKNSSGAAPRRGPYRITRRVKN